MNLGYGGFPNVGCAVGGEFRGRSSVCDGCAGWVSLPFADSPSSGRLGSWCRCSPWCPPAGIGSSAAGPKSFRRSSAAGPRLSPVRLCRLPGVFEFYFYFSVYNYSLFFYLYALPYVALSALILSYD